MYSVVAVGLNTNVMFLVVYHCIKQISTKCGDCDNNEDDDNMEKTDAAEQKYDMMLHGCFMVHFTMEVFLRTKHGKEVIRGISLSNPKPDIDLLFANISGCVARKKRLTVLASFEGEGGDPPTKKGECASATKGDDVVVVCSEPKAVIIYLSCWVCAVRQARLRIH